MNALEKRDAITAALNTRPDAIAILAKYGILRTDIGKNAPNFASVRDAMFDELCGGSGVPTGTTTLGAIQKEHGTYAGSSMPPAAPAPHLQTLQETLMATLEALKNPAPAAPVAGAVVVSPDIERRLAKVESSADTLIADHVALRDELNALQTALSSAPPAARARVAVAVAAATGGLSPMRALLAKVLPPGGNHNGVCVLAMGGSGTGKSYDAEEHAKAFDYAPAPFACSPVTEKYELMGCVTQTETGLAFSDGFISAGIRHAACGENVCLILDELPRLSDNLKMELLTLLTPRTARTGPFAGTRVFSLRTGRGLVDAATGICEPETIDCPVERLAFVATGNIGSQFLVRSGGIDEAVYKRFIHIRVNWNPAHAKDVFEKTLDAHGLKKGLAKYLLEFVEKTRELAKHSSVAYPACIRTVTRAIALSGGTDAGLRGELDALCAETLPGWENNGETIKANLDAINSTLVPILAHIA